MGVHGLSTVLQNDLDATSSVYWAVGKKNIFSKISFEELREKRCVLMWWCYRNMARYGVFFIDFFSLYNLSWYFNRNNWADEQVDYYVMCSRCINILMAYELIIKAIGHEKRAFGNVNNIFSSQSEWVINAFLVGIHPFSDWQSNLIFF